MDGPAIARPSGGAGVPELVAHIDLVSPKYNPRDRIYLGLEQETLQRGDE
jgi:hypothetical protein